MTEKTKKPITFLNREDETTRIGQVFDTPLLVKDKGWIPLTPMLAWGFLTWLAAKRQPQRTLMQNMGVGALMTIVTVGSEWCHNLSHAAAAKYSNCPMDALLLNYGLPLVIYFEPDDPAVTPRQHIQRSLGGPAFNLLALALSLLVRHSSPPNSTAHEVANAAAWMNGVIFFGGFLPHPAFDGGPVLKWSLVQLGSSQPQAKRIVRAANGVAAVGLAAAAVVLLKKKQPVLAGFVALMSGLSLAYVVGWLRNPD